MSPEDDEDLIYPEFGPVSKATADLVKQATGPGPRNKDLNPWYSYDDGDAIEWHRQPIQAPTLLRGGRFRWTVSWVVARNSMGDYGWCRTFMTRAGATRFQKKLELFVREPGE